MHFTSLASLDHSEGTVQLHSNNGTSNDLILHPAPNPNDPNDPLRWPRWKKHVCFASVCAFTFLANFGIGGLAPAFYGLSLQFEKTQTETSALLLWPILTFGVFNFFLLWSNIIGAFAGSSTEALGAAIVNDLYFLHERGNLMGVYMNSISGGNTIGPLICGFIITSYSWRVHKWLSFALTAANFLVVLFLCPETRYARSDSASPAASSTPSLDSVPIEAADLEKSVKANAHLVSVPKKSFVQDLSLWSGVPKDTNLLTLFLRPFPMIIYPAVIFSFLGYAVSLAWVVAINILNSFVLQAPPYNWKPSINGLINIPGLIGNLFGAWTGGWLVDKYSDYRSRKNGGVFEPETRLHLLIIPAVIVPAGCLAFGYGVAQTLHWTALFFGYGMVAVGLTFVPVCTMVYVSDCYLPVNADALLLVNGLKNVVAFGFLYGVVPWVTKSGYVDSFGTQAGVFVAIMALAIPLSLYGAKLRHKSAQWRIVLQ